MEIMGFSYTLYFGPAVLLPSIFLVACRHLRNCSAANDCALTSTRFDIDSEPKSAMSRPTERPEPVCTACVRPASSSVCQ